MSPTARRFQRYEMVFGELLTQFPAVIELTEPGVNPESTAAMLRSTWKQWITFGYPETGLDVQRAKDIFYQSAVIVRDGKVLIVAKDLMRTARQWTPGQDNAIAKVGSMPVARPTTMCLLRFAIARTDPRLLDVITACAILIDREAVDGAFEFSEWPDKSPDLSPFNVAINYDDQRKIYVML